MRGKRAEQKECLILVLDDQEVVEEYVQEVLGRKGFRSVSFSDPLKALDYFQKNAKTIDLVLSDVVMPEMNGVELATKIAKINMNTPVILFSGYSDKLINGIPLQNVKAVIEKPVLKNDLVQAVEGVLTSCKRSLEHTKK